MAPVGHLSWGSPLQNKRPDVTVHLPFMSVGIWVRASAVDRKHASEHEITKSDFIYTSMHVLLYVKFLALNAPKTFRVHTTAGTPDVFSVFIRMHTPARTYVFFLGAYYRTSNPHSMSPTFLRWTYAECTAVVACMMRVQEPYNVHPVRDPGCAIVCSPWVEHRLASFPFFIIAPTREISEQHAQIKKPQAWRAGIYACFSKHRAQLQGAEHAAADGCRVKAEGSAEIRAVCRQQHSAVQWIVHDPAGAEHVHCAWHGQWAWTATGSMISYSSTH